MASVFSVFIANSLAVVALKVTCACCRVKSLSSFFTSLKVEQGEKYPPFVLVSVFQISEDEGRG